MPEAGGRVVVFSENSPAWVFGAYAVCVARDVLVPVDHLSTAEERSYVLGDCEPALVLCSRHLLPTVERSLSVAWHRPRVLVLEELDALEPSSVAAAREGLVAPTSAPGARDALATANSDAHGS